MFNNFEKTKHNNSKLLEYFEKPKVQFGSEHNENSPKPTKTSRTTKSYYQTEKENNSDIEIIEIEETEETKRDSKNPFLDLLASQKKQNETNSTNNPRPEKLNVKEKKDKMKEEINLIKIPETEEKSQDKKKLLHEFFINSQLNQKENKQEKKKPKEKLGKSNKVQNMDIEESHQPYNNEINGEIMRKTVSQFGKLEFKSLSKNKTKNLTFDNSMFGDMVMIVELYNILIEIYSNKEPIEQENKQVLIEFEPDFQKLEFDSFCEILSFESEEGRKQFLNLIKNLLFMLLRVEEKELSLFGFNISSIELCDYFLQDLCRILLTVHFKQKEGELEETDILIPDKKTLKKSPLLKKLYQSCNYNSPFNDLGIKDRIELLKFLCDEILNEPSFQAEYEKLGHDLMLKYKNFNSNIELLCKHKGEVPLRATYEAILNELNDKNTQTAKEKYYFNKDIKLRAELEKSKNMFEKFKRIRPLGVDSADQIYWNFKAIPGIVVERRIESENKSEWFTFNEKSNLAHLSKALKGESITLSKKIQILSLTLPSFEKNSFESVDNNEDNEVSETDDEEEDGDMFERQVLSFSDFEEEDFIRKDNQENLDTMKIKEENKKIKKEEMVNPEWHLKMKNLFESKFGPDSIDNLLIYLINQQRFFNLNGNFKLKEFNNLKESILEYQNLENFDQKLTKFKEIFCLFYNQIGYKNYNQKHIYLFYCQTNVQRRENNKWSKFVQDSKNIFNLYFLVRLFLLIINRKMFMPKVKDCSVCETGIEFKAIENLEEFATEELHPSISLMRCEKCRAYIHKKCLDYDNISLKIKSNIICQTCLKKESEYQIESMDQDQFQNEPESNKISELNRLRVRKNIPNYLISMASSADSNKSKKTYKKKIKILEYSDSSDEDSDGSRGFSGNEANSKVKISKIKSNSIKRTSERLRSNGVKKNYCEIINVSESD